MPEEASTGGSVPALSVENLRVLYGDFVAVERASFDIAAGDCAAIIGPNGNGKSSIATAIAGLINRQGTVRINGATAPNDDSVWTARHGLTLVPERRQLFARMSVLDNVLLGCYAWTRSLRAARRAASTEEAFELFPELKSRHNQLAGTLSGGQQQMAAIARGLAARPRILIIDEPCLGLAEVVAKRVYAALSQLRTGSERTVIVIEENPARAMEICNVVVRVQNGISSGAMPVAGASNLAASHGQAPASTTSTP